MNDIQELVARGRILFSKAPKRLFIFLLINGKSSAKEISTKTGRSLSSVLQDLQKMRDLGLIMAKKDRKGEVLKKNGSIVYDKNPLVKHLSKSYFEGAVLPGGGKVVGIVGKATQTSRIKKAFSEISIPNEQQILDISRSEESQLYEFKQSGTKMKDICKAIAAFVHTRQGGIIFYGIEDGGAIGDTDRTRHSFEESIQNSVRNNINPPLPIKIVEKIVLGHAIILVCVPPWNRKEVYLFDGRAYIRRGNVNFVVKSEELKRLSKGEYID